MRTYSAQADAFSRDEPTFQEAYNWLVQSRLTELSAAGYDEATSHNLIQAEEQGIVANAFRDGANAAERIFGLAKARGFAPVKKEDPEETTEEKLDRLEKGQKASKSLSKARGGAAKRTKLKDIADMTDEEFEKLAPDAASLRKLMAQG